MRSALSVVAVITFVGCGFTNNTNYGKQGFGNAKLAITNAEGEHAVLRTGTAINVTTSEDLALQPNHLYRVVVNNITTGTEVAHADLLSDMNGQLELSTVAHDLGEFDGVKERHTLSISIEQGVAVPGGNDKTAATRPKLAEIQIPLMPHRPDLVGHGFQIDEVQPPHIFSAMSDGTPINAYVVGATPDNGEIGAPVYAAGNGFPDGVTKVDIYLVKDADKWQGKKIPQQGDTNHVLGPIVASVVDGKLAPVDIGWRPQGSDIGPYDLIVDVDRDGVYDYSFSEKDASDGEDKVGLTIQYSQAWFRAKKDKLASRFSADEAAKAAAAADKAAKDALAAATAPEAVTKANAARKAADDAAAQAALADAAAKACAAAFSVDFADAALCAKNGADADAAAKSAAQLAQQATASSAEAATAQKAWENILVSKMRASHKLMNLAFNSSSRSGQWQNDFTRKSRIYSYTNPDVQGLRNHTFITKVVVKHQDFFKFWMNPKMVTPGGPGVGRIKYSDIVVQYSGGMVQHSCTNAPPVTIINPDALPVDSVGLLKFDIIYDMNNDGYYDIGVDGLDVIAHTTSPHMVTVSELEKLDSSKIYGFSVAP